MRRGFPQAYRIIHGPQMRICFEFIGKMPKDSTSTDAASNTDLAAELSKLRKVCSDHKAYSTRTITQACTILDGFQSSDSLK